MDNRHLALLGMVLSAVYAFGNPLQPNVVSGTATFHQEGPRLEINTADKAVIHWDEFSIAPSEITHFIQPNERSVVLNRVMGTAQSMIQGSLRANGQVLLINQNGILVGRDAVVDTGSFVASSLDLIDSDEWRFKGSDRGSVVNQGTIYARNGDAILVGYHVENSGEIHAEMGSALLGAGQELWVQPKDSEKLFIRLSAGEADGAGVANSGKIRAASAELKADGNLYALALHHSGEIDALGVMEKGGEIFLIADEGSAYISGSVNAPGGNVLVDANHTCIDVGASIRADGTLTGHGGSVVAWGQEGIVVHGAISAKGGREGGDGGFVEVSSHGGMDFGWNVDVSAMNGETGHLLLDPTTVNIVAGGTTPRTFMDVPPTSWAALTNPADIDSNALADFLDMTGSVTITTNVLPDPGFPGTITVTSPVTWASGNKLTLIANDSITILADVYTSAAALPQTQEVLELTAPTIVIGDHLLVAAPLGVGGTTGRVIIDAPSSFSLLGGMGVDMMMPHRARLIGDQINVTGGAFTLESGTDLYCGALVQATRQFDGQFTGNIIINGNGGGAGIGGQQSLTPPPSSIYLSSDGNMTMTGGNGAAGNVGALLNLSNGGGDITCILGGDLNVQAGSAGDDGKSGFFSDSPGTFLVSARDVILKGGGVVATDSNAVLFANVGGDFTVNASRLLRAEGGATDNCGVIIAAGNTMTINASSIELVGGVLSNIAMGMPTNQVIISAFNQVVLNVTGDLSLTSQALPSSGVVNIGYFLAPVSVDIDVGGDININTYGGECSIRHLGAGPVTYNIDATNLNIAAFSNERAFIGVDDGTLNCNIRGACTIHGGAATPAMGINMVGFVGGGTAGLAANLNLTAENFSVTAGSADACYAGFMLGDYLTGVGGGGGEIHVTATGPGGIALNGGSANNTPAVIEIIGSAATNAIFFDTTYSFGNVVLTGSPVAGLTNAGARIVTSSGPIIDPVGGSIILNGTMSGPALISVGPGPAAELLLQAGVNIELLSSFSSIENLSAGDINLVVDADFPEPFFGQGLFRSVLGSSVTTNGGALRIFTSQQHLNEISGTLNGLNFSGGSLFVDTATEMWGVYYPSLLGGFSYTVFYKNILQLLTQQAATIASELATSLHPFNEFPGWVERFTISVEGFDPQVHRIRRRHLTHLNHPKTWTHLIPESQMID